MNTFNYILLFLITLIIGGQTADSPKPNYLFKILENDKTGYIDSTGKVIIYPIFHNSGEFSEGLASARLNGTYGYIDMTGKFVIPTQYDYAESFKDSVAKVYVDTNFFFINHKGEKVPDKIFNNNCGYKNGRAIIKTETKKYGLIDTKGKVILDTIFSYISEFNEGIAHVIGLNDNSDGYHESPMIFETGLVDTNGVFVVPFGKHKIISDFENGYYYIEDEIITDNLNKSKRDKTIRAGLLDSKGNLVYIKIFENTINISTVMNCNLSKITMVNHHKAGKNDFSDEEYEGLIDTKGDFVLNNPDIEEIYNFSDNRAFIKEKNKEIDKDDYTENYYVINTKGDVLNKKPFKKIGIKQFNNNLAFAGYEEKLGIIDTNLNFKTDPIFSAVMRIDNTNDYLFYTIDDSSKSKYHNYFDNNLNAGIIKTDGSIILKPNIKNLHRGWFKNGVILLLADGKYSYFNPNEGIVWEQKDFSSNSLLRLNLDIMMESYFISFDTSYTVDSLGYKIIDDEFKNKILPGGLRKNDVQVIVNENEKCVFKKEYQGIKVYLTNTEAINIPLPSQACQLEMIVQAMNKNGEWKDIEYIQHSWCGNAYKIMNLKPNNYWTFTTPVYEGDFNTKLRIKLEYFDPNDVTAKSEWDRRIITIYSNEYKGSVNPGQFWRKSYNIIPLGDLNPISSWEPLEPE